MHRGGTLGILISSALLLGAVSGWTAETPAPPPAPHHVRHAAAEKHSHWWQQHHRAKPHPKAVKPSKINQ